MAKSTLSKPTTPKQQKLVLYTHADSGCFYVGVFDYEDISDFNAYSALAKHYNRAKYLFNKVQADDNPRGMNSGFAMTLVNTNFTGWVRIELDEIYPDQAVAAVAKEEMIPELARIYGRFVGRNFFVKGVAGDGDKPSTWHLKWKSSHPKKWFDERAEFVLNTFGNLPNAVALRVAAYLEYASPTRKHNYGNYDIDCLANLHRYIRNRLGYDLPV